MSELDERAVARAINTCFESEGLPKCIKIDNGLPLVHIHQRDVPTLTELWWIGLGIEVVHNRPACPQQNGTVEGLQGTCSRWAQPKLRQSAEELQSSLDDANHIQRCVFRVPSKKNQTRQVLFPGLDANPRRYSPKVFSIERVREWQASKVWQRTVYENGSIRFCREIFYIGKGFSKTELTITFNLYENRWEFRDRDGKLIQHSNKPVFEELLILQHVNLVKEQ